MNRPTDIETKAPSFRLGGWRFGVAATVAVFIAYSVTLGVANNRTIGASLAGGAANTAPVIAFGAVVRQLIIDRLIGRSLGAQMAGHLLFCAAFSLLAYWLVTVLLGLINGTSPTEFIVRPFPSRAMAWQLLENVTIYGIIAALAYLHVKTEPVALILNDSAQGGDEPGRAMSRYFIRSGDDIKPIDVGSIVSIAGADDYAEVITLDGRHLVRMTLAEFEQALDSSRFIRVHRSRIVNLERIERAEPAGGGRLLLHMEDGEAIPASRNGSRILRERLL